MDMKDGFKILIIHNIAWSHYKAVVFNELYKLSLKERFDMKVLQIAINEKSRQSLGYLDLSIHKYPYKILFKKNYEEIGFIEKVITLIREVNNYEPDIVIVPGYFDWAYWIAVFYCKFKGKKIITGIESTEFDHKRMWFKEQIKRIFVKMCDGVFCYGTKSKEYSVKLGAHQDRVFTVFQATDNGTLEKLYIESKKNIESIRKEFGFKPFNFIFVGRLSPEKNVGLLVRAFAKVKKKLGKSKDWGLIIVGDGPLRTELEKLTINLNIMDSVYFVGGKSWKDVIRFYAASDVLILPSVSEPWGLVVNEAMVCGLPVVVSKRAGSYYDLVKEGENGFGFDPYDQKELEKIMSKFINNGLDMKRMGEKSREIIRDYTPKNAARQMLAGISEISKRC